MGGPASETYGCLEDADEVMKWINRIAVPINSGV